MSVFKEMYGTRCLGQTDPQCVNFINKKILPPTKRFCDCASKVEPLERTNWKTVGAAAVIGLVLVGGGAYAAYSDSPLGALSWIHGPGPAKDDPAVPSVSLRIQTDAGTSVPIDHPFQSGDQFRFLMRGPSSERVYGFYEDRESHKMTPLAAGPALDPNQDTNVPTGGAIKLDQNRGREIFEFVVSRAEIPAFAGTEPLDRSSFDEQLSQLKSHGGLATGRFQSKGGDIRLKSTNEGATIAKLELVHE
jgi:hypothetical protein